MDRSLVPVSQPVYFDLKSQGESRQEEESGAGLLELWELLLAHVWLIIGIAVAGGLAGLAISLPQPYIFQAREQVQLQEINPRFLNLPALSPTASEGTVESHVQTQVRILQSRQLRDQTVAKLLAVSSKPSTQSPDKLSELLQMAGFRPLRQPPARDNAVRMAANTLKVRDINSTSIVELVCDSTDSAVPAEFLTALVQEYIRQSIEDRWNSFQQSSAFLERQVKGLRDELQKSENQLQDYARSSGTLVTTGPGNVAEDKLRQIQQELSSATGLRIMAESRYEVAKSSPPNSVPEILNDPAVKDYQSKRTDLRTQLAQMSILFKPDHYKVQQLTEQIAQLGKAIESEQARIMEKIRNESESARMRERMLSAAYGAQTKTVADETAKLGLYNLLKREVDTNRILYDSMLKQVKEVSVVSAVRADHVRVVEPPVPPAAPYKPETAKNAVMGLTSGLFLGVVFVAVRKQADRKLRDPGDGIRHLHVPALGVVLAGGHESGRAQLRGPNEATPALAGLTSGNGASIPIELTTWSATPSPVAESFRGVLTSLLSMDSDRKVIVFTSPNPREGKTTIISNLAISLAEIDRKVLLVDADLRKPRLHGVFGISNAWGLTDVIAEGKAMETLPISSLARETSIPNLRLLPSGPGTASISKVLYSANLDRLLTKLRKEYDFILIDTPPMMNIFDARVIARRADGVVLVLRAGQTTKELARMAVERLMDDNIPIVGTVLNYWDPKTSRKSYYSNLTYYEPATREF